MFKHKISPLSCVRLGDPDDTEQWHAVVRLCRSLTPRIEEHPEHRALMLDLGGSERLLLGGNRSGSESRAVGEEGDETIAQSWPRLGDALTGLLTAAGLPGGGIAVGIGPTRTLAWLASSSAVCNAGATVVLPEQARSFLASLPLLTLQHLPDAAMVNSLAEMVAALDASGVCTLGQLARLPAEMLTRRFGADGSAVAQLAAGDDLRPLRPHDEPPWLGARLVFEPPLAVSHLAVALGPLAEKLALALAQRELAAGKMALALESERGIRLRVERRLAHPLGTTRALLGAAERLLAGLLNDVALRAPESPESLAITPDVLLPEEGERYVVLRLRLGALHPVTAEQRRLWAGEQRQAGTERVERLQAALRALQGNTGGKGGEHAAALLRAELREPDAVLPEERYRLTPRSS